MAPLSYYRIISFIYLVIKIAKNYQYANVEGQFSCPDQSSLFQENFFFWHLYPDFIFPSLKPTQKKRYVYMFQSDIMNYKGTAAGAGW
jgi:hypothetical protein